MIRKLRAALVVSLAVSTLSGSTVVAAPNWSQLIPFKKVDADPNKAYALGEDHGPWLVMCRCFAGDTAETDAHALVLELRDKFKLKAYVHKQRYDFTKAEKGIGIDPKGRPKVMVPANATKFDEIAVLVGDFQSVDDPKLAEVLAKIKVAKPKCLDINAGQGQTARYWGIRTATAKAEGKGPMKMAFVTRNPLLPEDYFAPKGLDPLVLDMNRHVEHSLLKNPAPYSVRIASFQGEKSMRIGDAKESDRTLFKKSKLEDGAIKAHNIVLALRAKGVEAWEFHDLHESIVTVGSFDWVSEKRGDGKDEINPAIHAVMELYKAKPVQLPGQATSFMSPTKVAGVSLDVQPLPVAVPKQSFGQTYARRGQE